MINNRSIIWDIKYTFSPKILLKGGNISNMLLETLKLLNTFEN